MTTPLPLASTHARLGARLGQADGYLVPLAYGDPAAEHGAVRDRVGMIDRSDRGVIETTGRDRAAFLQGMLSSDVKGLTERQGVRATLLDAHGKILSILLVHCLADRLLLETEARLATTTMEALERLHFSEQVELEDRSADIGVVTLAGPAARKTLEEALDRALPDLPLYHHTGVAWGGYTLRIVCARETGENGYDLWVAADGLAALWDGLLSAGARPIGREAWNVLRVEAGVVWHGVDVDASTLLLEAPLEDAYSLNKGCYVGQEVVARVTYRGHVNRRIVGFRFPDARVPAPGAIVRIGDRDVGRITSAVVSPALGRGLALGFLRREHWDPGTEVEVAGLDGLLRAEVSALPFYRRSLAVA